MAFNVVTRLIIAGTVLATGCAPISKAAVNHATPAGAVSSGDADVLQYGYNAIVERHIEHVSFASVALEGLAGLSTIDPAISLSRDGANVTLQAAGKEVARYAAPADGDAAGWVRLTLIAEGDARAASEGLRGASQEGVFEALFDATLAKLDRFSRYSNPDEARDHRASRNGFGGVGIQYEAAGEAIQISSIITDGPAARAQLQVGDRLTHIDETAIAGLGTREIERRLRGAVSSDVKLTVLRQGTDAPVTVSVRRTLVVPTTVSLTLDGGIALIRISGFNQRTAAGVAEKVREAREQGGAGLTGVILDLRGNPGGLLDQAVAIADQFMASGRIVSTRGRHRSANQTYDAAPGDLAEDLPTVVLVDGKSASASEILAAALQDSGRAVVIGTNSYGKGTVQTVVRMPNEAEMTLTWSRFYSPSDYALHGLGVLPTICTSSHKTEVEAASLVQTAAASEVAPLSARMALWRTVTLDQPDQRQALREACPSEKHADAAVDLEAARRVLGDRALYARAVAASRPSRAPLQHAAYRAP